MRKTFLIISFILLILFSVFMLYLNNVLIPTKIKARVIQGLSEAVGCKVDIEKLKYNPFKGIIIQGLIFYQDNEVNTAAILKVKEVSFNFFFLPLIKERKFIIPVIHINSPSLTLRYKKDSTLNISNIISKVQSNAKAGKSKFSVIVYKINIFSGACEFTDDHLAPPYKKTFQELSLGLSLKLPTSISFIGQARIPKENENSAKLLLKGEYNASSQEGKADIEIINLAYNDFAIYLNQMLPVKLNSGHIVSAKLKASYKDKSLDLNYTASAKDLELKAQDYIIASTDTDAKGSAKYNIENKEFDYNAGIKVIRGKVSGIKLIEKIENLVGELEIAKNSANFKDLKFKCLDSEFNAKGTITDYAQPKLKLQLASEQIKLERIAPLLPSMKGINISGNAKINLNIDGPVDGLPNGLTADINISDAKFKIEAIKEGINAITGKISIGADNLKWDNLRFNYNNKDYSSIGELTGFKSPKILFNVNSDILEIKSDIQVNNKIASIKELFAKSGDSRVTINGDVDFQNPASLGLMLTLKSNLETKDILPLLPKEVSDKINSLKISGKLNAAGHVSGRTEDLKSLNAVLKCDSDMLSAYNLKFTDTSFSLTQKNGLIDIPDLRTKAYSGNINASFVLDTVNANEFALKLRSQGIDLSLVKNDADLKNKNLQGILNLDADLYGALGKPETFKGLANITVQKGRLWEWKLFKGIGDLFLMPDFAKIVFEEATAQFEIADKNISTNNCTLKSKQLNLECTGKVGFDGALDISVLTNFNEEVIKDSADVRKFVTAVWGQLRKSMAIKITGTIKDPKYKVVPMPVDIIKNIKDFLKGK
ncbi:MAG: DUF748 domain-containing protein [Candidatus Omnitrophota bacterium]|nr:MAG: DUF748 domain-containing protein [Candidatus Omnitrophota bacterium]